MKIQKNIVFNSRVKRKPLKETKRVSSEQNGDYVQLNQYKLQVFHDTYFGLSVWVRLMNCDLKNWFDGCWWISSKSFVTELTINSDS